MNETFTRHAHTHTQCLSGNKRIVTHWEKNWEGRGGLVLRVSVGRGEGAFMFKRV